MNVLLVGEDAAGIQTLRGLAKTGHRVVAVMTSPSGDAKGAGGLYCVAKGLGYRMLPARLVRAPEFAMEIALQKVDILLNVHSLLMICPEVLDAPRLGSYNLHPGPLPRYAGLNSVCWAIYHGEKSYGVTLHKMVSKVDAGPIVYQSFFDLEESDTGLSLTAKCVKAGVPLVFRLLEALSEKPEGVCLQPQDMSQRGYFGREVPHGGRILWQLSARQVVDFIRACDFSPFASPWGQPRTSIGEREIAILKASHTGLTCSAAPGTVGKVQESGALVACGDEWVLVRRVQIDGRAASPVGVLSSGDHLGNGG